MPRKKYAVAALLFGDNPMYHLFAKLLFDQLRRQGYFAVADPILITVGDIDPKPWTDKGIQVIPARLREYPVRHNGPCPEVFYKYEIYRLTDYEKVLFTDIDVVVEGFDPFLFKMPTPLFLLEQHVPLACGNMLIKPDKDDYSALVELALNGHYHPASGWQNCGKAPAWPSWHRRLFPGRFLDSTYPLIREHSWNFFYAASEQGLLYYWHTYCKPGYSSYHFPSFFHLAGEGRSALLLTDDESTFWVACRMAGLEAEMREAMRYDVALRTQ